MSALATFVTRDQAQLYHRFYVPFFSPFPRERSTNETEIEPDRRLHMSNTLNQ